VKRALLDLRSADPEVRRAAAGRLAGLAVDGVDIRAAQPALTRALTDPDDGVRRAALHAVEMRADMGADVGLAVPTLLALAAQDHDVAYRRILWRTLRHAHARTPFFDRYPEILARGRSDADPKVRQQARSIVDSPA
jgi:HEAT repeat protein